MKGNPNVNLCVQLCSIHFLCIMMDFSKVLLEKYKEIHGEGFLVEEVFMKFWSHHETNLQNKDIFIFLKFMFFKPV